MAKMFDVRLLRQLGRWKQRDLAQVLGINVHELMKIERGLSELEAPLKKRILTALALNEADIANNEELLRLRECGEGYVTSRPEGQTTIPRTEALVSDKRPVIDLFCGVGGFSNGFEQTGNFQVVAGIDLLGDRLATFSLNHRAANAYGQDIRELRSDTIDDENPRPFVIVGGPPCQGFSSIRPFRNVEWNDPRNNLAEEFCRIVDDLRPEWVVFENVVGLITHSRGQTFSAVQSAFEEIGYRTSAKVLNAANYGLPQRRERLVIVGSLKGKAFKWPQPTHRVDQRSMVGNKARDLLISTSRDLFDDTLPSVTIDDAIGDLPELEAGEAATEYTNNVPSTYGEFIRNAAEKLTLHEATAHSRDMLKIIRLSGANIYALPPGLVSSGFSSSYSRLNGSEPSVTLTVNFVHPASNRCIHPYQHRALTPREGARLQGFFDTFSFSGSRSQIVKQIGNAVPPVLGKKIAEAILDSD